MKTKRLKIAETIDKQIIAQAAQLLCEGEVVAFPTETVYGLGADATNVQAIQKIFAAKGRPSDNPLIVHVATKEQIKALTRDYPAYVDKMIRAFSPGPITYVLPSNGTVAPNVTAGLSTVGVRIPNNQVALALLQACQIPVAAPSANTSGKPSPTNAGHVIEDLDGKIAAIIDGGAAKVGLESTVVDCTGLYPVILRLGNITAADIQAVVGQVEVWKGEQSKEIAPKSPGVKYKHYAPEVPLYLVRDNRQLQQVIEQVRAQGYRVGVLLPATLQDKVQADEVIVLGEELRDMAAYLYDTLRSLRNDTVDIVVSASFPDEQVGAALMDRLQRAATKII